MANEATINAIKTALQNEKKSIELYSNAAKTTKNPVVKKTMMFLADWEKNHYEKIERLNANLLGQMAIFDIKTECSEDALCVIKEFFGRNKEEFENKVKGSKDDIMIYETGMQIEKEGFKFYKKSASETDDDEAKQLFEFLANEENIHYIFLEDQHAYLSKPDSWFLNEEKWILEG
jgi:rubrerythrin